MSSTTLEINFIDYKPHEIFQCIKSKTIPITQPILSKIVNPDLKPSSQTQYNISFTLSGDTDYTTTIPIFSGKHNSIIALIDSDTIHSTIELYVKSHSKEIEIQTPTKDIYLFSSSLIDESIGICYCTL